MKSRKFRLATIAILLLYLVSCSSFPTPNKANDTLLIVPTHFIKYTSPYLFGRYHAKIVNVKWPAITRDVPIEPTNEYQIVQGLPEGNYVIPEYTFIYDIRPKDTKPRKCWVAFSLQKGKVTILEDIFEYTQRGDGQTFWYYGNWRLITVDELSKLYADVSQDENFKAWELSDSTNDLIEETKGSQDESIHTLDIQQE